MMENHWLVLFLLFAIRLALAEPDGIKEGIKEEPTTKVFTEVETEIITSIKAVTEPVPIPPESESDAAPAPPLSLLNAPSSIKTASSGQRVKNPESGSAFGLPWQSVDVSSKGTTTTTTTTTTLPPRVQQFNEHIRNQYKPQNQQQQKPQVQQQQTQQQYQPQTQQQEQHQQQSHYRPQSQSQYRPQFQQQQQTRPYVQQQSQQQVQSQQQTQQEVQTQNRIQPAFQQQSQEKVQPSLQQQSQIQVQPSFAEQSQQKVQPTLQQTQQRIKPPTQQRIQPPTQQRIQPPTQQRIQPTTQQPIQRVQPPSQQSQQQVQPSFSQQQQSQPAFQQVQSQEQVQPQIQQQTRYQYHQQSQPQVQDKFPPEFPKESYHHSIEETATGGKQYKASGVKTAPAVQTVSQEEGGNEVDPIIKEPGNEVEPKIKEPGNEVDPKIKEPYQSQPSEEERLKKADLALNEYFTDVLQNLSVKMKTGMDEPLGEVLDPVKLDDMQLQPLVAGQVFDVKMKKITVGGLSDFKITQLESQLSDSRIKVGIHYPKLTANCLFNANGSLYEIFKVTGKGNATIIFNDVYARTVLYLTKDDGVLQVTTADQPYVDFKSAEILFLDEEAPEGSEPIKAESVATQLGPLYFWVLTANAVDKIDYPLALYFNKALQGFPLSDFLDGYVLRQRHLRIHVPHNPLPYAYVSSDLGQI
ncbi:uncharacterized protein [Parasteatoda tepidariorum]|uniref:uncharacterized protein n=1 Tax=Parasteatoda tepidariorum TaxID=114398 RepID=UPI001C71E5E4|nr:mediator of RNA polymerase II transcription subunit 15 [Parasteatoda tepidariorum]